MSALVVKTERVDEITCAKEVYETPIRFTLRKHNLSKHRWNRVSVCLSVGALL